MACWTGPVPPPAAPPPTHARAHHHHPRIDIALERTPCMGMCPVYRVVIFGDGRVEWRGVANVAAVGIRHGHVTRSQLAALARALDAVQFYERDEHGAIPQPPVCTHTGSVFSCTSSISICTDTSHAIITVRRNGHVYRVADEHCRSSPLDDLEERIDEIAGTAPWVGR